MFLNAKIRPLTPRSEATICAVTTGKIAELAATAFVALLIVLLSVGDQIQRRTAQRRRECQSIPIAAKAFFHSDGRKPTVRATRFGNGASNKTTAIPSAPPTMVSQARAAKVETEYSPLAAMVTISAKA